MSTQRKLYVTWREGEDEEPRPVDACTSRWPAVLGASGLTLRRKVRVRPSRYEAFVDLWKWAPFWRHELTHVPQQPEPVIPWLWWLFRYVVWLPFRRRMEAEAHAAEQVEEQVAGENPYPRFRMVA